MAGISLRDYQTDAVERMKNGCILCGGVGSGKSRTALAYYYKQNGGKLGTKSYIRMPGTPKTCTSSPRREREILWNGRVSFRPSFSLFTRKSIPIKIRSSLIPGTISGSMQRLRMRSLYLTSSVLLVQEHGLRHS